MNIIMITGDGAIAYGKKNIFYEMLEEFSKHFNRIDIICPSNEKGKVICIHDNVYLHPSKITRKLHLDFLLHCQFAKKKIKELVSQREYGVISAHIVPPLFNQASAGLEMSEKLKIPVVMELMHVAGYPKAFSWQETFEQKTLIRFFKKNKKRIKHVRIINEFELEKFISDHDLVEKEKLFNVTSYYLDFTMFKPRDVERYPDTFVYAGRLEENKGIPLIIDAIKLIQDTHPGAKLKIVGDGILKKEIDERIKNEKLKDIVEATGWLPTQMDVAKEYNKATALIMASSCEGGPRVSVEAMASKAPVLVTRVGSMHDIIKDGENGLFIDWTPESIAEKMRFILENPEKAKEIGEKGFETSQPFEKSKILAQYAEELQKRAK